MCFVRGFCLLGKKEFFKTEHVQKQLAREFFFSFFQSTTTFHGTVAVSDPLPPHTTPKLTTAESLLLYYTTPCIDAKCKKTELLKLINKMDKKGNKINRSTENDISVGASKSMPATSEYLTSR